MSLGFSPPPVTANLNVWAQNIVSYLRRTASRLQFKPADAPATEDGILLWDATNGYPTVSMSGAWRQIVVADGHYLGIISSSVTAAAVNTAYALTYTAALPDTGIANDPAHPTRIVFDEGGEYVISFSAEINSGSSNSINFYFWPRVNGADVPGSTMVNTLKSNSSQLVVSRTSIFDFEPGDYLEAMWAISDTNGNLDATAATAFCPAAPASTITITRVKR